MTAPNFKPLKTYLAIILILMFASQDIRAEELPSIAEFTEGMEKVEGFYSFYWDDGKGELWLEIDRWNEEFIYYTSLSRALGSNDIGLDRAKLGRNRLVYFERRGEKAMLIQPNYGYRAESDNEQEQLAVEQSFAKSVIWAMTIVAADGDSVVVNANYWLTHDANNISRTLQRAGQGNYSIDRDRCAIYRENTKAFPNNTEFEVITTFEGQPEGWEVRSVAPSADSITLHQRHSFVKLPEPGYTPRAHHPQSGFIPLTYVDMATPFDESRIRRFITRHRLQKKDPGAEMSEAVEPIVYYVDSGVPEPVKSALLEGAGWWTEAFEAAGFVNGFQVRELPPGADPMDARYNVINWVHRSTRGWSYGSSITDPRTGEIIKGHVSLGSLRIRQDYLIATALTAPYGNEEKLKAAREMALARIRQLSAHEVGHTIGLLHNYTASTDDDASVMDYPHPYVKLAEDGSIDISSAYDTGIGEWDIQAVRYGYSQFAPEASEAKELADILEQTRTLGLSYLTDAEARPRGSAHPRAHLWDNGFDAAERLDEIMQIRAIALENFDENVLPAGMPMSELEKALVPLYLFHRYQTEAAVKMIGGYEYGYDIRGGSRHGLRPVPADDQRRALAALLTTLDPEALTLSERIFNMIPPPAPGYGRDRETFPGNAFVLDRVEIARSAAALTMELLFNPARLNRLALADDGNLTLREMLLSITEAVWRPEGLAGPAGAVEQAIRMELLETLFRAWHDDRVGDPARAVLLEHLLEMQGALAVEGKIASGPIRLLALTRLEAFMDEPEEYQPAPAPPLPPGSPIG